MGIVADFLTLFRRTPSLMASVEPRVEASAPTSVIGIPGGGNYSGRLQFEPNVLLREQAGYGLAGTYQVGEWQEMALTNPYVTAGLDFICAPIADARIDIEVDESLPKGQLQADFLRWALTERFKLAAHNDAAARGFLLSGFALFEPRAELVSCPVLGRPAFALAALEQRLPNSLATNAWDEDESGLVGIRQQGPKVGSGEWANLTLPAKDALLYSWKRQGLNWAGESQLRSVWYIANRIMPLVLKLVGVTTQREGAGLPVAFSTDPSAQVTPEQRRELMEFFANVSFHESSGIVMPTGFDVKWIHSPGANKGFVLDIWKQLGLVVLQQLGAQQMVLGTDNTGSRSVGEVHDARAMAFVRKVLAFEESILNGDSGECHSGLVRRLLAWNGLLDDSGVVPRVKLTPKRPELAPADLATALKTAKDAGLFTPTFQDENDFRERAGVSPITLEDRDEAKESAAALAPKLAPGGVPEDDVAEEPSSEVEMPEEEPKKARASAQRGGWLPWRPLRASEQSVAWEKLDAYFTAQRDVFEARVKPVVLAMLGMAAPAVAKAMADGTVTPGEVADVPLDTKRLDVVLRKYLGEVRTAGGKSMAEELSRKPLRAAAEEEDERDDEVITKEADDVIDAQLESVKRRIVNRTRGELERSAIDALRTGEGAEEVVSRTVSRQLDTGAFKADAGYVTTKAFNVGRDEAARIMGGIASVEYSALLDSATCEACRGDDGKTAAFNSAEHDAMLPPNRDCAGGDNCRCVLVMIPSDGGDK